jgi:hypothetical protein
MFKIKWNINHSLPVLSVDLIKNLNQFMNVSDSFQPDDELVYWQFAGPALVHTLRFVNNKWW